MNNRQNAIIVILLLFLVIITPVIAADYYGSLTDEASSADGTFTIKSTENSTIWFFQRGNNASTWTNNIGGEIWSVTISPDSKHIAVGSDGGLIWLFDQKGTVVWNKTFGNAGVKSIAFSKDGQYLDASNFMNQAFYITLEGNRATRPESPTISEETLVTPIGTLAQIPINLDLSGIESIFHKNLNLLLGIIIGLCLAGIIWYTVVRREYRKFSFGKDFITLKNFTIFSILLILIGFLPFFYPLNKYTELFQIAFEIGVLCFLLAYFLYAVKCWGARSQISAVLMLAIPLIFYFLSTTKIPDATNIIVDVIIQFCWYAIISAFLLFIIEKLKTGIDQNILKNSIYSRRYFYPDANYIFFGIAILSIIIVMSGTPGIWSSNVDSIIHPGSTNIPNIQSTASAQSMTAPTLSTTYQFQQIVAPTIPVFVSLNQFTTIEESKKSIDYVNTIRSHNGVYSIRFDSRVYNIAMARVNDMDKYGYMDHTNPQTGTCADSIKTQYGLSVSEYVAENAFGFDTGGHYSEGLENEAVDSWITSRGHRYNLLYPHLAGAVACSNGGHCVFLGLNNNGFGAGCHTGAEGMAFWNSIGKQPGEI